MAEKYGYELEALKAHKIDCLKALRNIVVPEIGKFIFENLTKETKGN